VSLLYSPTALASGPDSPAFESPRKLFHAWSSGIQLGVQLISCLNNASCYVSRSKRGHWHRPQCARKSHAA
jgi:hypothetical protein